MHPSTSEQEWEALRRERDSRRSRLRRLLALLAVAAGCWFATPDAYGGPYGEGIYGEAASVGRYLKDKLEVLFGSPGESKGVTTTVPDLCDYASAQGLLTGNYFCLRPDGGSINGQNDGGTAMALSSSGTPVTETRSICPNGPECAAVMGQRLDGGSRFATSALAQPGGNFSLCSLAVGFHSGNVGAATVSQEPGAYGTGTHLGSGGAGPSQGIFIVQTEDAGTPLVAVSSSLIPGALHLECGTYKRVTDGTSELRYYIDGVAQGAGLTNLGFPISQSAAWAVGNSASQVSPASGLYLGAFKTDTLLTGAQVTALAQAALGRVWSEQVTGTATTFTRASTAYCDPLDGGYGSWLASGVPCIVGGAYLSEPPATPKLLYNLTFDGGFTALGAIADGGSAASMVPVVTWDSADVLDPTGGNHATKVVFPATVWVGDATAIQQALTGTAAAWSGGSKFRTATGTATIYAYVYTGSSAPPASGLATCTVTTAWAPCNWLNATLSAASYNFSFGVDLRATIGTGQAAQAGSTIYVWLPNVETGAVRTTDVVNAGTALTRAATVAWVDGGTAGLSLTEGCAAFCVTPNFSGAAPAPTYLLDGNVGGTARLAYANGGDAFLKAYDGTRAASVATTFTAGSKQCFRTHWSATDNRPGIVADGGAGVLGVTAQDGGLGTEVAFSGFPSFGAGVFVGATQSGASQPNAYVSGVRLGSSSAGCQ